VVQALYACVLEADAVRGPLRANETMNRILRELDLEESRLEI
jgi:hypothetical protein